MSNNYDLKIDQLCNLIGLESGYQPSTVRKILNAMYKVILKQLELNQRIYFMDFGAFEMSERASGDRVVGDFVNGGTMIKYIEPRNKVSFKPSATLDRAINEGHFEAPNRKRKKYPKSQAAMMKEYYQKNKMVAKPTIEELACRALNVSQARADKEDKWDIYRKLKE